MFPGTMSVPRLRLIPHRLRLAALPPQANCLDANPLPQESAPAQPAPPSENKRAGLQWDNWLRSEEHTSELQSRFDLVCRLLLEKKKSIVTLYELQTKLGY